MSERLPEKGASGRFTAAAAKPRIEPRAPESFVPQRDAAAAALIDLKVRLHQQVLEMINLAAIDKMQPDEFGREIGELVREILARDQLPLNLKEKAQLTADIIDEFLGLGPLEPLLKDPTVSDILVNTCQQVQVERFGKLHPTAVRFKDEKHLLRIINKIVAAVGRRVDESQPMVDARLADGSRVNAVTPPVAVARALLSSRQFSKMPYSIERLIAIGSLSREVAEVLQAGRAARVRP